MPGVKNETIYFVPNNSYEKFYLAVKGLTVSIKDLGVDMSDVGEDAKVRGGRREKDRQRKREREREREREKEIQRWMLQQKTIL